MKNTVIIAISCLLAGGSLGYFLGAGNEVEPIALAESSTTRLSDRDRRSAGGGSGEDTSAKSYEAIAAEPGQMNRIQGLVDLYSNLSPGEYADEADKLDTLPFSERILAAYLLFAAWAEVSPIDAMDHANSKMGFAGNFVKPTVLQSWAATDPSATASYYESNKGEFAMMGMMGRGRGGRGGDSGASVIAGEWAKQDSDGALTWAKSLEGKDGARATSGVLSELAKSDPAKAASMVSEVEEDGRAQAYASIAGEWAKQDWGATESWISGLPADQQDGALGSAIKSLAASDPTLAAQKTLAIPEGNARTNAMEEVSGEMAKTDASGAMSWVMDNGNEDAQKESVGDVMQAWVTQDKGAALGWINEQSEGGVRDAAVQSYVFNDRTGSPQESLVLAETISDDGSRDRAVGMAAFRWVNEDPVPAKEYIQSSDSMSDRMKERLMSRGE
jgi:hypothetical protein